jgi:hypothetical protein
MSCAGDKSGSNNGEQAVGTPSGRRVEQSWSLPTSYAGESKVSELPPSVTCRQA